MMTIKVNIPSVDRPQRLEYVLRFAFNLPFSGLDIKLEEDNALEGEIIWNLEGKEVRLPFDASWLGRDFSPEHPGKHIDHFSPHFWYGIFFFLSRMEVTLHKEYDRHGRWLPPRHDDQWPDRKRPFLDEMIASFLDFFCSEFALTHLDLGRSYTPILSVDVDQWYAYKGKSLTRHLKGGIRDLLRGRPDRLARRIRTIAGEKDPYDTLESMQDMLKVADVPSEMFVLVRSDTTWDRQVDLPEEKVRSLTASWERIGIHPSYYAVTEQRILKEKEELQRMLRREVSMSRFHFLRYELTKAPAALRAAGLYHDKSQAIPNDVGFLVGTSQVYFHYDLQEDVATDLKLYPQLAMDVTMKDYLKWSPSEAADELKPMIEACKRHQGYCSLIWHNSSFYESEGWAGWDKCLKDLLQMMKK
jgi:hypothetical protein